MQATHDTMTSRDRSSMRNTLRRAATAIHLARARASAVGILRTWRARAAHQRQRRHSLRMAVQRGKQNRSREMFRTWRRAHELRR